MKMSASKNINNEKRILMVLGFQGNKDIMGAEVEVVEE